jgi:hypothetical protein
MNSYPRSRLFFNVSRVSRVLGAQVLFRLCGSLSSTFECISTVNRPLAQIVLWHVKISTLYGHPNKFLDPIRDGSVEPAIRRNGLRLRIQRSARAFRAKNWARLLVGHRHSPYFVEGDDASGIYWFALESRLYGTY